MFKTAIKKLESYMDKKHPEFRGKFYINRKNKIIHVGMDTVIFLFLLFCFSNLNIKMCRLLKIWKKEIRTSTLPRAIREYWKVFFPN